MEPSRYIFIHLDDLVYSLEEASAMLMQACKRGMPFRLQAVCQCADEAMLVLNRCEPEELPVDVRWIDISDLSPRDLPALMQERWSSGFEPVGSVSSAPGDGPLKRYLLLQRVKQ
ncbi:MAG: hypothetical protein GX946_04645 [Oligosphaeraceae bacterium]|nr:hypothetical protein [Oligosphaeraceae bacterium]